MYLKDSFEKLKKFDVELADIVIAEEERQKETLCLIASENYASPISLALEGSVFANKNAEGYPGARYVSGIELADKIENMAKDRIKKLFGCEHVNVQSLSATISNVAVLRALLKPGDTILSMELNQGGHLSHGASFHYSGKMYNVVYYTLDKDTEMINMKEVEELALKHKPKIIICGASSYPRTIDYKEFGRIAKEVDAYLLADIAHPVGLIAADLIESPVPYADVVTTSTHKTWRGSRGCGIIMCKEELAKKIDYNIFPGLQGAPKMDMIAARAAQAKESMTTEFKEYQEQVLKNAKTLSSTLIDEGLRLVSGGTNTHLILVDVRNLISSGKEAEDLLEKVGIIVNKNMIPYDELSPKVTSGIRIGTPALTTRGLMEDEIKKVGVLLAETLKNKNNENRLEAIAKKVKDISERYPLFNDRWMPKNN